MLIAAIVIIAEVLGIISAIDAVMTARTPQGSIAWAVSLVTFPYVAVPAYWVFGRSRFEGYVGARQLAEEKLLQVAPETRADSGRFFVPRERMPEGMRAASSLVDLPPSQNNAVDLLIDGEATFASIFDGIARAEHYVLVQFYILRADGLGNELKDRLIAKAKDGVRVFLVYDELGSLDLPKSYLEELRAAGAEASPFNTTQGLRNRFQLNFRNHRKIVVVDGRESWVGGHNVGDEYMGRDPKIGHWRDTHVHIVGPATLAVQLSFLEDWYWATGEIPDLDWTAVPAENSNIPLFIGPSSPADARETASLMFLQAISSAEKRLWIASPYFVPDEAIMKAIELADLRGADVRILVPDKSDNALVNLSVMTYLEELAGTDIQMYRYTNGFLHQKVMLIDDHLSIIGTANLDNRSLRLNFEISVAIEDADFNRQVAEMLEADFANSRQMDPRYLASQPFWYRLAARAARLTAPIQ